MDGIMKFWLLKLKLNNYEEQLNLLHTNKGQELKI
jgi:hypothetical protein